MKWFIKCLRHYADFSGRARRKEYWMFTLFYYIALFVWVFALALLAVSTDNLDDAQSMQIAIQLSWMSLMGLPGMAVAVRRLHDLGKSGWMVLISLVPLIGGIWLLVLMATTGQTGPNRFGPDPKTSSETFPDRAKLTSAGVVIIIAAGIALLGNLFRWLLPELYFGISHPVPFASIARSLIAEGALLAAGIMLVGATGRERIRPALWIVLVVLGYFGVAGLTGLPAQFGMLSDEFFPICFLFDNLARVLFNFSIVLVAALVLFAPQNRAAVRGAALAAMTMGGLCFVVRIFTAINYSDMGAFGGMLSSLNAVSTIGWILFVWTLFSRRETPQETAMPAQPATSEAHG